MPKKLEEIRRAVERKKRAGKSKVKEPWAAATATYKKMKKKGGSAKRSSSRRGRR